MRYGFTTGSCAAAASKAAAYMLLGGEKIENIVIHTPKGIDFDAKIYDISFEKDAVSCAVVKDSGDDPDVTNGLKIFSKVRILEDKGSVSDSTDTADADYISSRISIKAGEGIGTVTAPGLDRPVGSPAINSVPLAMIESEVKQVMELFDFEGNLEITISVPGGREVAEKTYNERLGIIGGISIIGTSGIVEPMSTRAIKDTTHLQIRQKIALGHKKIIISPGNYGLDFIQNNLNYDFDKAIKCSNFIGDTIDCAVREGVESLLLVGHIGKLIKLAGGIMNTHSHEADCRMELMTAIFLEVGGELDGALKILKCLNTTEAYAIIRQEHKEKEFGNRLMERCSRNLKKRAGSGMNIECIIFSNEDGIIGKTAGADSLLEEIKNE